MFKKIEIWILYLVLLLSIFSTVLFGTLVRHEILYEGKTLDKYNLGWISETALLLVESPKKIKDFFKNPNRVEDKFIQQKGFSGTNNSKESYLLLSRYDGDIEEAVVELIDLTNFKVLHKWNPDFDRFHNLVELKAEFEFLNRDHTDTRRTLVHPKLTKDGGLIFNSATLKKINSCSELVFQNSHDIFHHSIETDSDGNIWTPSHLYPHSLPVEITGNDPRGFRDDAIVKLSSDGEVIFEKSVAQIFIDNGLEYLLFTLSDQNKFTEDPIHLNDIQPVESNTDYWKKGDVFISLRHQSMVLLYRPSTNKIIWKFTGPIFHQHDVDILDDHRVSIFNNNSKNYKIGDKVDGYNEVIIYDFKTGKYFSYLKESLKINNVKTITEGRSEILPNGDLFVEESNYGRTLYFNDDGSLRWSHVNRAKNGNVYTSNWSRVLYRKEDLQNVRNFLRNKVECNE